MTKPAWAMSLAALLLIALLMWMVMRQPSAKPQPPQEAVDHPATPAPQDGKQKDEKDQIAGPPGGDKGTTGAPPTPTPQRRNGSPRREMSFNVTAANRSVKPHPTPEVAADLAPAALITSVVDDETLRHFEKSQLFLRAFRNADDGDVAAEIAEDRQRSRDLLFKNVLLRREAEAKGNLAVGGVLGELEPLLIDIANLPEGAAPEEIRAVRERLRKRDVIATLQLYSARPVFARAAGD